MEKRSFEISCSDRCSQYFSDDENYRICIFGEIFLPSGAKLDQKNFETDFLPAFNKDTDGFLTNCEGAFVFVLYNKRQNELHLLSDPFGNLALYYSQNNETVYFSTDSKQLREKSELKEKNDHAFLEYLAFGFPLSGKTFIKGIERLGVAAHVRFNPIGLSTAKYFTPGFQRRPKSEYSGVLSHIKELVVENVEIRTRGEGIRSGLSGGFDSRVTLAALAHLGRRNVELFTLGPQDSNDVILAKKAGIAAGFRHKFFQFDQDFMRDLPKYIEQTVILSSGGLGIQSSPQLAVWEQTAGQSQYLLDSHGGMIYRRLSLKSQIHTAKKYPAFADFLFQKMKSPLSRSSVLKPEINKESEIQTLLSLQEYCESFSQHLTDGDKADCFYIDQICAHRYALAGNLEMQYMQVSHPLLSARIWELLSMLDVKFRSLNLVSHYLVNELYPALKKIPLDNSGFKVPYRGYSYLRYLPHAYERYFIKKIGKYFPNLAKNLSLQHSPYTSSLVIASDMKRIREIALSQSPVFSQYFNSSEIEKLDLYDPKLLEVVNAKLLFGSLI